MKLIRISTLALVAAALPLAACGPSEEERRRDEAVDALADALGDREAAERIAAAGAGVAEGASTPEEAFAQTFAAMLNSAAMGAAEPGFEADPAALDAGGRPRGETRLSGGFSPDPHTLAAQAGGDIELATQSGLERCRGYVQRAPGHALRYSRAEGGLVIGYTSPGDAALAVRDPDGLWYCDDDSGGELDPRVLIADASDGRYDIWIANLAPGEILDGTLSFSTSVAPPEGAAAAVGGESSAIANDFAQRMLAAASADTGSTMPAVAAGSGLESVGTTINAGAAASGGRHDYHGEAGGLVMPVSHGGPVSLIGVTNYQCRGGFDPAPSVEIDYDGRGNDLFISGRSTMDTTIVIHAPDGRWYCNDDAWSLNPGIRFADARRGLYQVWLGTYAGAVFGEGEVFVSTTGPGPQR